MHALKHPVLLFILPASCSLALACGSSADSEPAPAEAVTPTAGISPADTTAEQPPVTMETPITSPDPASGTSATSSPEPGVGGFTSQCGGSSCYEDAVIDDFADDQVNAIGNSNDTEGYWYVWPEALGGPILDESAPNKIVASAVALPEFGGGIGVGFNSVGGIDCPADLSSFEGIRVTAKSLSGVDEPMIASLPIPGTNQVPQGLCEEDCYNDHSVAIVVTAAGGSIDIPFGDVAQEASWGTKAEFSASEVQGIKLKKKEEGESFNIEISRVELYGNSGGTCSNGTTGAAGAAGQ